MKRDLDKKMETTSNTSRLLLTARFLVNDRTSNFVKQYIMSKLGKFGLVYVYTFGAKIQIELFTF